MSKHGKGYHHSQEQVHCEFCGRWGTWLKDVGQNRCVDHMHHGRNKNV